MSDTASQLLLFRVGDRVYATAVGAVRRITAARGPDERVVAASTLGEPRAARRGLVLDCGAAGERTVAVDAIVGIEAVAGTDLRPLPPFAAVCLRRATVAGFAMMRGQPTAVVDLRALVAD